MPAQFRLRLPLRLFDDIYDYIYATTPPPCHSMMPLMDTFKIDICYSAARYFALYDGSDDARRVMRATL